MSWRGANGLYVARKLGLQGLQLCLDAGDADSLPAASSQWLDLAGSGYDFDFGAAGAAPAISGTAGQLALGNYLAFDGGDYLTYDSANEAWMNSIHKDGAVFWGACWIYPAGSAQNRIVGNYGNSASNIGFGWYINTSTGGHTFLQARGTGSFGYGPTSIQGFADGAWQFAAIAINEAVGTGFQCRNGVFSALTPSYGTPSASDATYTTQVAANGNNTTPLPNGARLGMLLMGTGSIPPSGQMAALFDATRGRFQV